MPVNKEFLTALARLTVLFLSLSGAVCIPLGAVLMALPCLALQAAGWGILAIGVLSLWQLLRILALRLFR